MAPCEPETEHEREGDSQYMLEAWSGESATSSTTSTSQSQTSRTEENSLSDTAYDVAMSLHAIDDVIEFLPAYNGRHSCPPVYSFIAPPGSEDKGRKLRRNSSALEHFDTSDLERGSNAEKETTQEPVNPPLPPLGQKRYKGQTVCLRIGAIVLSVLSIAGLVALCMRNHFVEDLESAGVDGHDFFTCVDVGTHIACDSSMVGSLSYADWEQWKPDHCEDDSGSHEYRCSIDPQSLQ